LIGLYFQNDIIVVNFEFIIILEIEAKLIADITIVSIDNNIFIIILFIPLNNVVFNIVINILQTKGTNEVVVIM